VSEFNSILWDENLIKRYDIPGPRYTSYPTAADFNEHITANDLLSNLQSSKSNQHDLSLYVHIPFCKNICYYCACNKVITKNTDLADIYLKHLLNEVKLISAHLKSNQQVKQLHFGGGTPTFLTNTQISQIINTLKDNFNFSKNDADNDFGIEIDPREASWQTIGFLRELGFNRISFGVQDLNNEVQRAVNRVHDFSLIDNLIMAARTLAFHSINIDLIYGLPKQTADKFAETITQIIELRPDRISLFNYAHLPSRFKPQRRINNDELPNSNTKLKILRASIISLQNTGYRYIGMDHFALPEDELAIAQNQHLLQRNFQGYSTHINCDLLGFGSSAISSIGNLYSQNFSDLNAYQECLSHNKLAVWRGIISNQDDQIRRYIISEIMCHGYLDIGAIENKFKLNFADYFSDNLTKLKPMVDDGLLEINPKYLKVLPVGKLLVRVIAMQFDSYLPKAQTSRFSKVI